MVPQEVEWCLSPDLDEYFSINVLEQMEKTIRRIPNVTNISCDRLDIYSKEVRVGPPKHLGTNKIHRRHDYTWAQPIYEHLCWKHQGISEVEIYNEDIYLIHDQDYKKVERSPLYLKMLTDEYETNPSNCWTLWYLVNHYFKEQDLENFIKTGSDFLKYSSKDNRYFEIKSILSNFYNSNQIPPELLLLLKNVI